MSWERVGNGSGTDSNNIYYREAGSSGRWFSSTAEVPASDLSASEVPAGRTLHTDAPPDTAPAALRDTYAAAHPPPEPSGGGTRRRPVMTAEVLHTGPAYSGDMAQVADRLRGAGIDPDAYFAAHPPPASGAARTNWINEVRNVPAGAEGDATLRDNYNIHAAEYELNAMRAKGVPVGDAYAYLRAQHLLAPGSTPDAYPVHNGAVRLGTPPGDHASALASIPSSGTPPHSTTPVSDVTASLVDFGDRRHPAPDSLFGRMNASGTTGATRTGMVRDETRRLEITNGWMDYAMRPTNGSPPGLGYTREQAMGTLQNMSPPLLDATGRPTAFNINDGAHALFNVSEGTTITNGSAFNAPPPGGGAPPYSPRSPSLTVGGTAWRMGQPVPSYTGEPDPLTRGAIVYSNAHPASPAAPGGTPTGTPAPTATGVPTATGGLTMASSVPPGGARLSGEALDTLRDQVTWYQQNGQPIPRDLAAQANFNGIDTSGLTVETGSGAGASGGVGTTGGGGTTGGATGPFAAVPPAPTGPPTPPASGPLRTEWDRMIGMGFEPAEVAEYQRQHPGRDDATINGSFSRPDGSPIPASERAGVVTRTRGELRDGMINETADGLMATANAQHITPPLTRENALLMAEQMYRERTSAGDGDPTLSQMLGVRTNVAEDLHFLAEPNHADRINGTTPPGLLRRTAVHEENAFYTAARAADPHASWNGAAGQGHLRGFLARDSGRGAAMLNDPSAIREARLHPSPPLGARLAAYRTLPADQRTAIEGAVTASGAPETPDFSRIPAANRGAAEVNWQQTVIQHNWGEATALRARDWATADHVRDRGETVHDNNLRDSQAYARDMRQQRNTERNQREQLAMNMASQFGQMGLQMGQSQLNHMNQLTLQQMQAMFALTQQLIAQGTPKPFDIVMSMLSGGRR